MSTGKENERNWKPESKKVLKLSSGTVAEKSRKSVILSQDRIKILPNRGSRSLIQNIKTQKVNLIEFGCNSLYYVQVWYILHDPQ